MAIAASSPFKAEADCRGTKCGTCVSPALWNGRYVKGQWSKFRREWRWDDHVWDLKRYCLIPAELVCLVKVHVMLCTAAGNSQEVHIYRKQRLPSHILYVLSLSYPRHAVRIKVCENRTDFWMQKMLSIKLSTSISMKSSFERIWPWFTSPTKLQQMLVPQTD